MNITIGTRVPDEVSQDIDYIAKEEQQDASKIMRSIVTRGVQEKLIQLALTKYAKHEVSVGRAA
ncbi:MAG: hypothetical protein Q7K43_05410, partial [Candidatus Woesearchaeota archaeon]|nr:hypothetical protein [Candidatus Woesearchaeota archaeon]